MSDMSEDFKFINELKKERHANFHKINMDVLNKSGLTLQVVNAGETVLFRDKFKADFYPSTGRWRCNNKTYSGGAKAFLKFLAKG